MMMFQARWQLWIFAAFISLCQCSLVNIRSPYSVKDTHCVPKAWREIGPAPAGHVLNLQIGLKQDRFHELEKLLYQGMDGT